MDAGSGGTFALFEHAISPRNSRAGCRRLLGRNQQGSAMVYYEDPAAAGDRENSQRRVAVEDCLLSAVTNEEPPLQPDSVAFGSDQMVEVINSVGKAR